MGKLTEIGNANCTICTFLYLSGLDFRCLALPKKGENWHLQGEEANENEFTWTAGA